MRSWSDELPRVHGLSGDHGWDDSDEAPLRGLRWPLFVVAGAAYFGSVWLLSGLAPLPMLASSLRRDHTPNDRVTVHTASTSKTSWRDARV